MKKYQIDKLFVADVVRVGETYNKRLYKSIFILKDNEFFNVVTGQEMPHSSDCDTDQIGCENVYNLLKKYPDILPHKNMLSEYEVFEIETKINGKLLENDKDDFEF